MALPAMIPSMAKNRLQELKGVEVTVGWAYECLRLVAEVRRDMSVNETLEAMWSRLLDSDFREAGVMAGPVLPPDLVQFDVKRLLGKYALMVVQDVERRRGAAIQLTLSDGWQEVKVQLEEETVKTVKLPNWIPFGTKLLLLGPLTARRGVIVVQAGQVEVWGGEVHQPVPPRLLNQDQEEADYGHQQFYQGYQPLALQPPQQQAFALPQPQQLPNGSLPIGAPKAKLIIATCSLISATRFALVMSDPTKLPGPIRGLGSAQLDDNQWNFALEDHKELRDCAVRLLIREIRVEPLPDFILATFQGPPGVEPSTIDLSPLEPRLLAELLPFQREGVQYGVSKGGRVLIADDMGLGKTVQALALASYYHTSWPVLVVAPSGMRFGWRAEVLHWLPTVGPQDISVITTGKDTVGNSLFVIISYDLLDAKKDELKKRKFQFVILDESHMVKDDKSVRYKAVEPLARGAAHLVLLSGTPALSRPRELYTQVRLIDPNFFTNKREFGKRYCDLKMVSIGNMRQVEDDRGASNTAELAVLLRAHCMVRRVKEEVHDQLAQLPVKHRHKVELVVASSQEMEERREEAEREGQEAGPQEVQQRKKLLQWFAASALAKLPAVQGHLRGVLAEDRKCLVFCHHQAMVAGVVDLLEEQDVGFVKIDGGVGSEERAHQVHRFQTDPSCKVAVLSLKAANTGLTLTAAELVVFAELFWNPGDLLQAEDRAHRIGQTRAVTCQYLVARGTADDHMWPMIEAKLEVLGQVGLTRETFRGMEE